MHLLLAAVLAAAPAVHVISVHGPKSDLVLARLKAVPGVTTIDATDLHQYLLRTEGLFPMQDFDGFSAAPVKDWAPASAEIWTKGVAHCHTLVGDPPWSAMAAALTCANRLSVYLWQQYATQRQATRVFELELSIDNRKHEARVRGAVWEPTSRDQLFFNESGPEADLEKTIEKVVNALIAKKGTLQARNVISELESAALGDPFSGQAKVTSPVALKKTCAALPARLTVTPPGVLADSLMARWAPAGATGPALACALTFNEHTEAGVGEVMTIVTTLLTCSSTIVTSELARTTAGNRSTADLASERLVQGLAMKLCAAKTAPTR
ncbi:MAG: hypothetical protein Q8L48_36160 [Archangium sp.]|nr:hypothetical protein [Archangium sp.]